MSECDRICPKCGRLLRSEHEICPEDGAALIEVEIGTEDPRIGQVIDGRFTLIGVLGTGGMGAVYRALQHTMERQAAIKLLKKEITGDPETVQRFLHEARLASRLEHPNVITLFDFGQSEDGELYIAMELLKGRSLRDILDEDLYLDLDRTVSLLGQVCDALQSAHDNDVVHRDLKPENIFVIPGAGRSGEFVKVIDFGIAKVHALDDGQTLTQTGVVFGTPRYMSPEQAVGDKVDYRTDIYALGVLLYEVLTGLVPFRHESALKVIMAHIHDDPPPLLDVRPDLPKAVAALYERALAKEADDRPQSATAFKEALYDAASGHLPSTEPVKAVVASATDTEAATIRAKPSTSAVTTVRDEADETVRDADLPQTAPVAAIPRPASKRLLIGVVVVLLVAATAMGLGSYFVTSISVEPNEQTSTVTDAGPEPTVTEWASFPSRMKSQRDVLRIGSLSVEAIWGSLVGPAIFGKTYRLGLEGEVIPVLVREMPTKDNGGSRPNPTGGLIVTWKLRPGLRWSDGEPVTAEDLLLTLTTFRNRHLIDARAPDPLTVVSEWDDAVSEAFKPLIPWPSHVVAKIREESDGGGVLEYARTTPMPGMGPYRVVEFRAGAQLVLEANPHFPGPPPAIPRLEIVQAESDELIAMFERGEIDMIFPNHITKEEASTLRQRMPEAVHIRPSSWAALLLPDLSVPLLAQIEVRKALLQSIDRRTLATEESGPEATISHAPLNGKLPTGVVRYDFDPDAAKAAVTKVGATGAELTLSHSTTATHVRLAKRLEESFKAIGFNIKRRPLDYDLIRDMSRMGNHKGLLLVIRSVRDESLPLAYWNVPYINGVFSRTVRTPAYDDWVASLIDRHERALQPQRQRQHLEALATAFSEKLPALPLFFRTEIVAADPALRGWEDTPPNKHFSNYLDDWYFVSQRSPHH